MRWHFTLEHLQPVDVNDRCSSSWLDPDQIEHLINLAFDATKYTESCPLMISTSTSSRIIIISEVSCHKGQRFDSCVISGFHTLRASLQMLIHAFIGCLQACLQLICIIPLVFRRNFWGCDRQIQWRSVLSSIYQVIWRVVGRFMDSCVVGSDYCLEAILPHLLIFANVFADQVIHCSVYPFYAAISRRPVCCSSQLLYSKARCDIRRFREHTGVLSEKLNSTVLLFCREAVRKIFYQTLNVLSVI